MDSRGQRWANEDPLVLGIVSEPGPLLGTGDPTEISICQNKHERQEGEGPLGVVSMMPVTISQAELIKGIRRNMRIFLGVGTGKEEGEGDTESFRPTVPPTVCSAGVSGDSCCGQITH